MRRPWITSGPTGECRLDGEFVDYYEVLQASPRADAETIERIFRHLAKRYHPDNQQTGDAEQFQRLMDAHRVLSDDERRAAYDVRYEEGRALRWAIAQEAADADGFDYDKTLRDRLLTLLYVQRRRNVDKAAIGNFELEQLLSCPTEHLEFHVWYLREKRLVERTDRGFVITALGVDEAESSRGELTRDHLIAEHASGDRTEPRKSLAPRTR